MSEKGNRSKSTGKHVVQTEIPSQSVQRKKTTSQPFRMKGGMLIGASGRPLVVDEIDIPSPYTRQYHQMERNIHFMGDKTAQKFGEQFMQSAKNFDQHDSLPEAREQGRMVYRSWPKNISAKNDISEPTGTKKYISGFGSLSVSRVPEALQFTQDQFKKGLPGDPMTSAPATLLGNDPGHAENLWSGQGPGMVSTLLPEHAYVQMEAFNRRAQHSQASPELKQINAQMQASITRPHLFENKDLSSGVMEIKGETGRFGKPSMGQDNPKADFKLRENATRYQSYMKSQGNSGLDIHNEMTMFYRQSGHHAPAIEMKNVQMQPMKTVPKPVLGRFSFGQKQRVPDGPPVTVQRPEDPKRATSTLKQVLQTPNTGYPVLKK